MTCENYMKLKFLCPQIKFCWNTDLLIYLQMICGCFCPTVTVVTTMTRWPAKPKIFATWTFTEFVNPVQTDSWPP